ncbi:MAG: LysM peptidoglycan-binding domain-containing protein [Opitutales bacterium]
MKNIMTFSTIIAVHVVAFIMIAVQPACTSTKDSPNKAPSKKNAPQAKQANNTEVLSIEELPEGSPALRAAPSRPAWTLDANKKSQGEVLVNEENQAPTSGLLMPTELDSKVEVDSLVKDSAMTETYVVKAGDNLTKIAKANKTTLSAIKDLNNLKNNNIYVGQKLKIPAPSESSSIVPQKPLTTKAVDSKNVYVVKSGDSLSKVAAQNKTTISAIKELNALKNDVIFVGQKLKLPEASKVVSAPAQAPKSSDNYETYTIKRGDTLGAIALANKISLAKIQKLNPSVNPNKLQVGQVIVINEKPLAPTVSQDKAPVVNLTPASTPAPVVEPTPVVVPTPAPDLTPKVEEKAPVVEPAPEPTVEEINILTI